MMQFPGWPYNPSLPFSQRLNAACPDAGNGSQEALSVCFKNIEHLITNHHDA